MRPKTLLTWTAAALVAAAPLKSTAQTWQTVDDFQVAPGLNAAAGDIGTDPSGSILYSVGGATDTDGVRTGVARVSTDSGQSWSIVDGFKPAGWAWTQYRGFGSAANGALFTAGELWDGVPNIGTKNWIVRRSIDGGVTWTTQDVFDDGAGGKPSCGDIKAAPSGAIYAAGVTAAQGGANGWSWLVRKSSDGGASWTTVDQVVTPGFSEARAIGFHPNGSVFVVGYMSDSKGRFRWTTRRSVNGGATWSTVDSYQAGNGLFAKAQSITVDSSGAVYVAGMAIGFQKGRYTQLWVVRRSTDGGGSWSAVDNFTVGTSSSPYALAGPNAITIAPSGLIYVCGYSDGGAPNHWLVRRGTPGANGAISWATVDDFQLVAGQSAQAWAITSGGLGNIYATGRAADASGTEHWLTRRLAAP